MTKADVNSCPELLTRGEIANHARSNLFVSIHFNKPATSILGIFLQAHGSIGLYNGSKSSAKQLAGLLSANVSSSLGINNQGATEDDGTAVLKATVTDMTASIIEVGRLSGPDLTAILGAGAVGKVAAGIKAALDNFIKQ
jgi:N-acetylmuramoyl-L-alanine amidase